MLTNEQFFRLIIMIIAIIIGTTIKFNLIIPSMFFISKKYTTIAFIIAVTIIGILNSCLKKVQKPAHIIQKDTNKNVFITLDEDGIYYNNGVEEGKLKAIGVSNFYPNILTNFCEVVKVKPMVNQVELHPYYTQEKALETMKYYDVIPEAWAPLGGGRYNPFEDEMLKGIAAKYNKSVGQVILRWNVQRGVVVIPKSTHVERIKENIDIFDFELNEEEMKQISSLDMGYSGSRAKHFEPDFVRMVLNNKIHD